MLIYEENKMSIYDHTEADPKCKGCENITERITDNKKICACHCFPHTKWWFENCPQATHIKKKNEEDPIKEP
jgi:hypothetical protein